MKKLVIYIFLFILFTPLWQVHANEEFLADYEIIYDIEENGETNVTQTITLTNLENDVIATGYTLNIKQIEIYDVSATDSNGKVEPKIERTGDNTSIYASLNDYIIGEGRQNKLTLNFKTKDIASKVGRIWNINIPQSKIPETTLIYNVSIKVPDSLGPLIFISPSPTISEKEESIKKTIYRFTKKDIENSPLTASFGTHQLLNYKLIYQIENPNFFSSNFEIALPTDIKHYQNVKYTSIQPQPNKTRIDKDGNMIAVYKLKPHEKKEITVNGVGRISGTQINPKLGGTFSEIPRNLLIYTQDRKYWESNTAEVKAIANKLYNDKLNVAENAKEIYKFLTENYHYDFNIINQTYVDRKGAEAAINRQNSLACMEFTDLFIAIARSMGIPAREINGYALSDDENTKPLSIRFEEKDSLHAWPEFFDPKFGWVQIDPTWGSTSQADYFTKLDTSHFAFVRKGESSEYPLPAGAYRFDNKSDLVDVEFSQTAEEENFSPMIELKKTWTLNILKLMQGQQKYKLTNTGNVMVYTKDNKAIPPSNSTMIYIGKEANSVNLRDYNGNDLLFPIH